MNDLEVIKWHSFVKKRLVNLKEKKLVVRDVNIIKKYFGIIIGNGDAHAEFDIRKRRFTVERSKKCMEILNH